MQIVDLSAPLFTGSPVYPGDPPVRITPVASVATDGYAVAQLELSDQAGTHVETQAHFLARGRTLDQEPLARFIGRASVVDVPCRLLTHADVVPAAARIERQPFLLLRSGYNAGGRPGPLDPRTPARPVVPLDVLCWLVARGVRLLGIDAFDFDAAPDYPGHAYLLGEGVLVVEGLVNLERLPLEVQFYAVPLPLVGTGAAPCRAFALVD